jgi:hypothetical protein
LYGIFYECLRPGGILVTSGMRGRPLSEYLLHLAEIPVHYRTVADLERLARVLPFRQVRTNMDELEIQSILVAGK